MLHFSIVPGSYHLADSKKKISAQLHVSQEAASLEDDLMLNPHISPLTGKKGLVELGPSGEKWGKVVMNGSDWDLSPES